MTRTKYMQDRSNWSITITNDDEIIDSVTYDVSTWFITDDGYSYELISKGFNNDIGDNWAQSCNIYGTPGSDTIENCTTTCNTEGIECGDGGYCDTESGLCVCDETAGYYPQCQGSSSCTKCKLIPMVEDCTVRRKQNMTDGSRYAYYTWTQLQSDNQIFYNLYYFNASIDCSSPIGGCNDTKDYPLKTFETIARVDYTDNLTINGSVTASILVCQDASCSTYKAYESAKRSCKLITQQSSASDDSTPDNESMTLILVVVVGIGLLMVVCCVLYIKRRRMSDSITTTNTNQLQIQLLNDVHLDSSLAPIDNEISVAAGLGKEQVGRMATKSEALYEKGRQSLETDGNETSGVEGQKSYHEQRVMRGNSEAMYNYNPPEQDVEIVSNGATSPKEDGEDEKKDDNDDNGMNTDGFIGDGNVNLDQVELNVPKTNDFDQS